MKKIFIILSMFLLLCGCGSNETNILDKFVKKLENTDRYVLKGTMSIVSNEDTFTYDVEASKSKDDYYKVSLINKTNNHEQVILKNHDGVYVVTPDLNKSFKFQSDWPNNGSQSYLLDVLLNDVVNDDKAIVSKDEKYHYIQCKVNYPNNNTLYSEKIYLDDDYNVKKVEVLDKDGNIKITLNISDIDYKPKFNKDYFMLSSLIEEESLDQNKENINSDNKALENDSENKNSSINKENEETENTGNFLEDIIYPLYIPQNTHLSTKDTIETDNGNRAILTFSGDNPFVLVEEVSYRYDEMEIIPVNGDPLILADSIGAISNNSLYWTSNGIDYYLSSTSIAPDELMVIAEGLSGTSIIVSSEK